MKSYFIAFTLLLVLLNSATAEITITGKSGGFVFNPSDVTVMEGEKITFILGSNHDLHTDNIPEGAVDFFASLGTTLIFIPTVAGVYHYHCNPHEYLGMYGSFTVKQSPYIVLSLITEPTICGDAMITLSVSSNVTFGGTNMFKIQLSDENGSFMNYKELISTVSGQSLLQFNISSQVSASLRYKIRAVSSDPFIIGKALEQDLSINYVAIPSVSLSQFPSGEVCFDTPVTVTAIAQGIQGNIKYSWLVNHTSTGVIIDKYLFQGFTDATKMIICNLTAQPAGCTSQEVILNSDSFKINLKSHILPVASITGSVDQGCINKYKILAEISGGGIAPALIWNIPGVIENQNEILIDNLPDAVLLTVVSDLSCASPVTITSNIIFKASFAESPCKKYSITDIGNNTLSITSINTIEPGYKNWYLDRQYLKSFTGTFLEAKNSGVYQLVYGGNNCCETTSDGVNLIISTLTGLNAEELKEYFKIYPNPTREKLIISYRNGDFQMLSYSIMDLRGEIFVKDLILTAKCSKGKGSECTCNSLKEINISALKTGIYILKLYNEGKYIGSYKVFKEE